MPRILPYLAPIKACAELGQEAYEVVDDLKIVFLFDGGFKVSGEKDTVSIRFDDPDLLVVMTGPNPVEIYRVPYNHLVGFELIMSGEESGEMRSDSVKFFRN